MSTLACLVIDINYTDMPCSKVGGPQNVTNRKFRGLQKFIRLAASANLAIFGFTDSIFFAILQFFLQTQFFANLMLPLIRKYIISLFINRGLNCPNSKLYKKIGFTKPADFVVVLP
jgi:hypothetical protein